MMLFLARSALCIGLVAAAGAGVGVGQITTAVERGTRASVEDAGRACLASADCLRAGLTALEGADPPLRTPGLHRAEPPKRKFGGPARAEPDPHR